MAVCKSIRERLATAKWPQLRSDITISEIGDMMGIPSSSFIQRICLACITYTMEVDCHATLGYGRL
jgi:hypothetical protein